MKDSIFNTIVFRIQLFICMYETVRNSKCGNVEQKKKKKERKEKMEKTMFYCMLANVCKLHVRGRKRLL